MRALLSALVLFSAQTHAASGDFKAEPPKPSATAVATALPALAPTALAPAAEGLSPTSSTALSGTAQALSVTAIAVDLSPTAEPTPELPIQIDLKTVESATLGKLVKGLDPEKDMIYFDAVNTELLEDTGPGIWEVNSQALLLELALRSIRDDKTSRQALKMAVLAGDPRAKVAQAKAYEQKLAETYIKNAEAGDERAKEELARLAANGNLTARDYLGLDKPKGLTPTANALSPTAKALSSTAAPVPVSVSPTAVPIKR